MNTHSDKSSSAANGLGQETGGDELDAASVSRGTGTTRTKPGIRIKRNTDAHEG